MIAFAYDGAVMYYDRSHDGVGRGIAFPVFGKLYRAVHEALVNIHSCFVFEFESIWLILLCMTTDMTLKNSYDAVRAVLASHYGVAEADAMARVIFDELLHRTAVDIVLRKDTIISGFMHDKLMKVVSRLLDDEPLQYILGKTRFYGNELVVTPAVLIPRPETEELVDIVVKDWGGRSDLAVLDICTGSGCIAVSLARTLKFADVSGVDLSPEAISVAKENASRLRVNVGFKVADALELSTDAGAAYDIIVSNPPYITEREKSAMAPNVLDYEPHMALFVPDDDPLRFYRAIGRYACSALKPEGMLYFEINPLFADELKTMLRDMGLRDVYSLADMTGRQRFVTAKSPES
ncbi:peptide chain release factor N(5)-glutamine methyltransferase [bacterium J10(2018)]|nr:peptide chain release factor N(5)-glutamine methyltransferase [bacterium J10(2018)]